MINQPALYCPGIDEWFLKQCYYFLDWFPNCYKDPLFGGGKELGDLSSTAKLYLFIHGHDSMPIFTNETGKSWTAADMAELLESDGLSKNHKDLELLVCNAGLSVNSNKIAEELKKLQQEYKLAQNNGDDKKAKKIAKTFELLEKKSKPSKDLTSKQILPLAAELVKELSDRGYADLSITCYQAPISVIFSQGIELQVKNENGKTYNVNAEDSGLKVVWKSLKTQ